MNNLKCIIITILCTVVYLLIGFGTKRLFQRAKHPTYKIWATPIIWPIPLCLIALSYEYSTFTEDDND